MWTNYLSKVTGHFTGTTDEILEWAARKWSLDEDWFKAQAYHESSGKESEVGDNGESFGILQDKDSPHTPLDHSGWGGYPGTHLSTALCADFYNGQTVGQIAAQNGGRQAGWDYVMWGAVGSWFSGNWYDTDAQTYISNPNDPSNPGVKQNLANRDWEQLGSS
jgi:hypothetical protein